MKNVIGKLRQLGRSRRIHIKIEMLISQSDPRKLPSQIRLEKVPIRFAAVSGRRNRRCSAEHHLVDHEFAVVFTYRTSRLLEARIGQVCAAGPFPSFPPIEMAAGDFPFEFSRQPHSLPFSEGRGLIKGHVTDRRIRHDLSQAAERELMPLVITPVPVKRRDDAVLVDPIPAFGMPQTMVAIAAVIHKLRKFGVGHQASGNGEVIEVYLVPRQFIIKTESVACVADLVDTGIDVTTAR